MLLHMHSLRSVDVVPCGVLAIAVAVGCSVVHTMTGCVLGAWRMSQSCVSSAAVRDGRRHPTCRLLVTAAAVAAVRC